MTIRVCYSCKTEFDTEKDKYAVVWQLPYLSFICMPCSEKPEFKELEVTKNHQED